jgi:hypothetical protein
VTLIASTHVVIAPADVHTLSNVGALLLDGDENVASLVIETDGGIGETNPLHGVTDDLLVVQRGLGGDSPKTMTMPVLLAVSQATLE